MPVDRNDEPIRIFVCYAHEDKPWFDSNNRYNLIPFLAESLRKQNVVFWYDKELVGGDVYERLISTEIARSDLAILMVSQWFLNSSFIEQKELPPIAERSRQGQMSIVPVLIEQCDWSDNIILAERQMVPGPRPLIEYTENEIKWQQIRFEILETMKARIKSILAAREQSRMKLKQPENTLKDVRPQTESNAPDLKNMNSEDENIRTNSQDDSADVKLKTEQPSPSPPDKMDSPLPTLPLKRLTAAELRIVCNQRSEVQKTWLSIQKPDTSPGLPQMLERGQILYLKMEKAFVADQFSEARAVAKDLAAVCEDIHRQIARRDAALTSHKRAAEAEQTCTKIQASRLAATNWDTAHRFIKQGHEAYADQLFEVAAGHWREAERLLKATATIARSARRVELKSFVLSTTELLRGCNGKPGDKEKQQSMELTRQHFLTREEARPFVKAAWNLYKDPSADPLPDNILPDTLRLEGYGLSLTSTKRMLLRARVWGSITAIAAVVLLSALALWLRHAPHQRKTIALSVARQHHKPQDEPALLHAPFDMDAANSAQNSWADYLGTQTGMQNSIGMKFVLIPSGTFSMGTPDTEEGRYSDEGPQHTVALNKPIWMGMTVVTQAQWKSLMGNNPSTFKGDDLPVETVTWEDAMDYCTKLSQKENENYRLPTEAEWEYACRAGTSGQFFTGDGEEALTKAGWFDANSDQMTHPLCLKAANPFGLYDMHGNVWEWCSDWYVAPYLKDYQINPTGPENGKSRVLRGGSWNLSARDSRSGVRLGKEPASRNNYMGFRLVLELN